MRKVVNELGANLPKAHDLCQIAEEDPYAVITIWCGDHLHMARLV